MPPRPSQKRAAEPRAADAQKKTRFVEPSEDPARFEETVEATLEDRTARSRRKVKTEGYDSDSSDEGGESVVRSRAANASGSGVAQEDEDEDMFAVGEKDTKVDTTSGDGTKKKHEYLRLGDIEGQEFNEAQGENDSDESDEPEDEDDAERKAKAGMGFELSSFNMREEMEEGKFTEDGSYVRAFDAHAQHDRWMDGVDEREMKRARKRKREREKVESDRIKAEEQALADAGGKPSLERDLLAMLKRGESVLEALQRLGAQAKKAQKLDKRYAFSHDLSSLTHTYQCQEG
jgi:CD2 antigen cytoplasmic tail-binding protein 2